ncbi:MAG: aldo/keto reductase [Parvularculaceae bacterium]
MKIAASLLQAPLRLGFGCAGAWAQPAVAEKTAARIVHAAADLGVRHFDTGSSYGVAEERLGRIMAAADNAEDWFVSTKAGTRNIGFGRVAKEFSEPAIRHSVETSLRRLGRERIDLLYLHGPNAAVVRDAGETFKRLKDEGKIRFSGVCGDHKAVDAAARFDGVDAVMAIYNFFDRSVADAFERARDKGLTVVAAGPLAQALYDRKLADARSAADYWALARARLKSGDVRRASTGPAAAPLFEQPDKTPVEAALAFVLENPVVDVAVISTTKPAHLDQLVRLAQATPRPAFPPSSGASGANAPTTIARAHAKKVKSLAVRIEKLNAKIAALTATRNKLKASQAKTLAAKDAVIAELAKQLNDKDIEVNELTERLEDARRFADQQSAERES